jgi:RHS repeat-associated protein
MTSDGSLSYAFDAAGRLKTAGTNNSCEYDGDGRKVKQVSGGYPLFYLWSSVLGEPVVELDSSGGVYRAYVLSSGGQMLAVQSYDGGFYWLHTDHLGNGRKLTNSSGTVIYRAEFDPHGQMLYEWQSSGQTYLNSHKFTGYERDWATNLNYAKARTYNHNRARFMQPDPLGLAAADLTDPQSLNQYSYVGNDPANFTDPTGLFCYARYEVTTTYGNGQVIGQTWEFIGIFCDSYYQPIQPIDGGGGVGGGGGNLQQLFTSLNSNDEAIKALTDCYNKAQAKYSAKYPNLLKDTTTGSIVGLIYGLLGNYFSARHVNPKVDSAIEHRKDPIKLDPVKPSRGAAARQTVIGIAVTDGAIVAHNTITGFGTAAGATGGLADDRAKCREEVNKKYGTNFKEERVDSLINAQRNAFASPIFP